MATDSEDPPLHLPRILCLHGGGTNAQILTLQARAFTRRLRSDFRFVFADAPTLCPPHPAILPFFSDFGPFRRWVRWLPEHPAPPGGDAAAADAIWTQCRDAMAADPGTGAWVGVLGFSQGAKIAASLLWAQQQAHKLPASEKPLTDFKFAVLMAGSGPVINVDSRLDQLPKGVAGAAQLGMEDWPEEGQGEEHVLAIPTIHVHGFQDPGLENHRKLLKLYCKPETTTLFEWDGDHRLPIKEDDVEPIARKMMELAE